MDFEEWLVTCPKKPSGVLRATSIRHYLQGLRTASKDMLKLNVIQKPLEDMSLPELDLAIALIFRTPEFVSKDTTGDNMYSNAVKKYRCYVAECQPDHCIEEAEAKKVASDSSITTTEREAIVKARIGQGLYREKLMKKYSGRCVITHLNMPSLLIASHIKPWYISSNEERISGENGLLLSATYDRLFDSGLITFESNGAIRLSGMVTCENAGLLRIHNGEIFDLKMTKEMALFLEYHRDVIFSR